MSTLTYFDCIKFANLTKTTVVEEQPWKEQKGKWAIHNGKHRVHIEEYPFKLLYLTSNMTLADFQPIHGLLGIKEKIHLLYSDSSKEYLEKNKVFADYERLTRYTFKEYILSFIESEVSTYKKTVDQIDVKYYIDPPIITPRTFSQKIPNAIRQFINDNDNDLKGKVGILKAEPGQGKTFLCQHVTKSAISSMGYVPLLIQSNQWARMAVKDLRSISKTITNALKSFGATIGWIEGNEDEFIRIALKADIFRLVFDGFDEYILKNSFLEKPKDVLSFLTELAKNSGARILITSRTSFWTINVDENDFFNDLLIYELHPFDLSEARKYFNNRLSNENSKNIATQIIKSLLNRNKDIAGRGFILSLVAELAETMKTKEFEEASTLKWLLTSFCEREQERQGLPLNGQEQMLLLKDMSSEIVQGLYPEDEELEILISGIKRELEPDTIKNTISKLKSHPLIESNQKKWAFQNEQVFYYILAGKIYRDIVESPEKAIKLIENFYLKESKGKSLLSNICDWIVALDMEESNREDVSPDFLEKTIEVFSPRINTNEGGPDKDNTLSIFITSILTISLEKKHKSGTKEQRTNFLLNTCKNPISKLTFLGALSNFDFSNICFENCRFENIFWAKCRFNRETVFKNCSFYSCIPVENCEGFHLVKYENCKMDNAFESVRNSILIQNQQKEYNKEDLSSELKGLTLRFITKNGLPNLSIEKNDFENRGTITKSKYRHEILDLFSRIALDKIQISGTEDGGYKVKNEAYNDFTFFHNNNTFVGVLKEIYERLSEKLKLD